MAAVQSEDTGPEIAVRKIVHNLGYRYRLHVHALSRPNSYQIAPSRSLKRLSTAMRCLLSARGTTSWRTPTRFPRPIWRSTARPDRT